jgi:class 3 adenylate cyclase/predicted ATPase
LILGCGLALGLSEADVTAEIGDWLEVLGLGRYAEVFAENEIDPEALPFLTEEDLKDIGVALGARRKILAAITRPAPAGPAELAAQPLERQSVGVEAERRQLTVMFVDLVGSTALSERLDPEDLRELLRAYQTSCADAVAQFDGHVAKYIGDGLLVYFGYPQAHEDDAQRAVSAGLAIVEGIHSLNQGLTNSVEADLSIRVGIHTGLVVAGEMGAGETLEADAIVGVTPNLAARLEGLAKPGTIAISAATHTLVDGLFEFEDLGAQLLKGVSEPVMVYQVSGKSDAPSRFEAALRRGLTPLIGREEEVGLLVNRWEQAIEGEGQLVLLSGEAGVGKSRILRAFRNRIDDDPHSRIIYFGSPYHRNSAFYPAIDQLERALRFAREDSADDRLRKLEETLDELDISPDATVPALAQLLNLDTGGGYIIPETGPQQLKSMIVEALVSMVTAMANQQPVLIVFEDLHVADPSTVELIQRLVEQLKGARALILVTYRPEFNPNWSGYPHATALVLNRLSRREGAALIMEIANGKTLPQAVVDQIVERTDGVPLYVEELTKTILESDALTEQDDRYILSGSLSGLTIPSSLQDSLMARLDRLAPVKEVAQLAATIGRVFDYDLLAAVTHLDETDLTEALENLIQAELVFRLGTSPRSRYEFKHALVQDVAYQSLLNSTRHDYHRRIAAAMETRFPEIAESQPELLARHFTEAGLSAQAIPHWLAAAQQAALRSANQDAIVHCTRAMELLPGIEASATRDQQELDLLLVQGLAQMAAKGFGSPDIFHTYTRARKLATKLDNDAALFTVTWGQWINHQQQAKIDQARDLAEDVSTIATRLGDPELELQAHHANWTTRLFLAEHQAVAASVSRGLEIYDPEKHRSHTFRFGGHDPGVCAHVHNALTLWIQGFPDQSALESQRAIELAERLSHPLSRVIAIAMGSFVRQHLGDIQGVIEASRTTIELCSEFEVPHYLGVGHIMHGWAAAATGDTENGIAEMQSGLEIFGETGAAMRRTYYLALLAQAYGMADQISEGLEAILEAGQAVEMVGERWWLPEIHRVWGELQSKMSPGLLMEAEEKFTQSIDVARSQNAKSLELRGTISIAQLWAEQNQIEKGRDALLSVYNGFSEGLETADLRQAAVLIDEFA